MSPSLNGYLLITKCSIYLITIPSQRSRFAAYEQSKVSQQSVESAFSSRDTSHYVQTATQNFLLTF